MQHCLFNFSCLYEPWQVMLLPMLLLQLLDQPPLLQLVPPPYHLHQY
jgi:hypothetical protein